MLATTHVAVSNLEDASAMTIARFTFAYGQEIKNHPDVLVVDEFSMIDCVLYTHLATIIHHASQAGGVQCIFAGDWEQLPPVHNVYLGTQCQSMRDRP